MRKANAEVIKTCLALIKKGMRNIDIAEQVGIPAQNISRYRRIMKAGKPADILGPKIIRDVDLMPIAAVARKWGCSRQHVYNLLHKAEEEQP